MLENMTLKELKEKIANDDLNWNKISKDEIADVLKFEKMKNITDVNRMQNWISALNAIKKEVQTKINQNMANFARSVFRYEENNTEITDIAEWFLLKQNTCRQQDARQPNGMFGEKIQKLCYYAEAWCLVLYDQSIAKDAEFHAWMHGPVNLTLYRKFMGLKWHKLDNPEETRSHLYKVLCPQQLHVLECVWETYGQYGFDELEMLVHQETPWQEKRIGLGLLEPGDRTISKESMKKYYSKIQTKET